MALSKCMKCICKCIPESLTTVSKSTLIRLRFYSAIRPAPDNLSDLGLKWKLAII